MQWCSLGTKHELVQEIPRITNIPKSIILGRYPTNCTLAQRMSWASKRQTTREEDMAYCLMGLFDVHMPPIYGEGSEKAFLRLQQEILRRNLDQTLFLWVPSHEPYNKGLLATSPRAFCTHYECFNWLEQLVAAEDVHFNKTRDDPNPYNLFTPMRYMPDNRHYSEEQGLFAGPLVDVQSNVGSNGLELQLLSYGGDQVLDTKEPPQKIVVVFDVLVQLSYTHTSISYVLEREYMAGDAGFILDRLGAMRRLICTEKASVPLLGIAVLLERKLISISQIPVSAPSGPAKFRFSVPFPEMVLKEGVIWQAADSESLLCSLTETFECIAGAVFINHVCPKSSEAQKQILVFGTRGRLSPVWAFLTATYADNVNDPSTKMFYDE